MLAETHSEGVEKDIPRRTESRAQCLVLTGIDHHLNRVVFLMNLTKANAMSNEVGSMSSTFVVTLILVMV